MDVCLICQRFSYDKTATINNTIENIQIKNILYDLNFKFPFISQHMSQSICLECCYNLQELYTFRDYCCDLLLYQTGEEEEEDNYNCQICAGEIEKSKLVAPTTRINGVLFHNSDILSQICAYSINNKSENFCIKCYQDLIRVYGFYLKCNESLNFWTDHVIEASANMIENETNLSYKCDICLKTFKRKDYLLKHVKIHADDGPQCDVCLKSFTGNYALKRHFRSHTGVKPFKCHICSKLFAQRDTMKYHLLLHKDERPYKCGQCSKSFAIPSSLKRHMGVHSIERPHICNVCGKSFTHSNYLKGHLRIHTGEKPYKCGVCLRAFTTSTHLKKHLFTHTDAKPHTCHICLKSFRHAHYLKTHLQIHTGEKPYKCDICLRAFAVKDYLRAHLITHW